MPPPNSRSASSNVSDTGGTSPSYRRINATVEENALPVSEVHSEDESTAPWDTFPHVSPLFGSHLSPPRTNDSPSALPPIVSRYAVPHYTSSNRFLTVFGLGSRLNPSEILSESGRQRRPRPRPLLQTRPVTATEPFFSMNFIPDQLRNIGRSLRSRENAQSSSDLYESDGQSSLDEEEPLQHQLTSSFDEFNYTDDELVGLEFHTAEQELVNAETTSEPRNSTTSQFVDSQFIDYIGSSRTQDHSNNERSTLSIQNLLLRSARQNNHLFDSVLPAPPRLRSQRGSTSGVPLQRQNAIRHRSREEMKTTSGIAKKSMTREQRSRARLEEVAVVNANFEHLANEIERILMELQRRKRQTQKSPIFEIETKRKDISRVLLRGGGGNGRMSFRTSEWVAPDYKESMSEFLTKRRFAQMSLSAEAPLNKRKRSDQIAQKRQKTVDGKLAREKIALDIPSPKPPNLLANLSSKEIDNILSCQYSSYFTSGSSFDLNHLDPHGFEANLCLPIVNYETKVVEALFKFTANPKAGNSSNWDSLFSFIEYFPFSYYHLPLNSALSQRAYLIQRIKEAFKVRLPLEDIFPQASFRIFATGNIIDFKKNDMRFLDIEDTLWDPLCVHFHKYRANLVRVQLLSWLRINPFLQVQEDYMYIYIEEMVKKFKEMENSSRILKKHVIVAARDIHLLSTQNYAFTRPNQRDKETRNVVSLGNKQSARYIDDWEFKFTNTLCEKLVEENPVTLVNIQLNYILFTVKVDVLDVLDRFISYILDFIRLNNLKNCSNQDYKTYKDFYTVIKSQQRSPLLEREDDKLHLLCSLNRKTGQVEIQHSAQHLRHFGLSSTREQDHRSSSIPSEGKEFLDAWQGARNALRLFSLNPNLQPPLVSQMLGVPVGFSSHKNNGGGCQSYSFV